LWALDHAGCAPHEALMVGDRADNDVAPARQVGMWTLLLRVPHAAKAYRPRGEYESLYFESQERASISRIAPAGPDEKPDAIAESIDTMLSAIDEIAQRALSPSERPSPRR
jgi:FMN phosphatase YigB (HAD superfamily)